MSAVAKSLIIVVSGPGGVGKSTIVEELVKRDDRLWLSRSCTQSLARVAHSRASYSMNSSRRKNKLSQQPVPRVVIKS